MLEYETIINYALIGLRNEKKILQKDVQEISKLLSETIKNYKEPEKIKEKENKEPEKIKEKENKEYKLSFRELKNSRE